MEKKYNKMRLLIVTQAVDKNDPTLGFFHEWITQFSNIYSHVSVVALKTGVYSFPENISVYSLGKEIGNSRCTRVMRFYRSIFSLRKQYDCVFVHMNPEYVLLGGIFWRLMQKKVILWYVHKHVSLLLRFGLFCVHAVCTSSKESFRLQSKKVHVVGHGIQTDVLVPGIHDINESVTPFHIVSINRISPIKNYDTLIDGLLCLPETFSWRLSIIGAPATHKQEAYYFSLRKRVEDSGLNQKVHFLGPVPHEKILLYLQSADLFVNLSGTGSIDKSVLEAMSVGVPILTSNEAFEPFFRINNLSCCFIRNNSKEIAERILFFSQKNKKEKREMREKLRAIVVAEYDLRALVKKIYTVFQTLP